MSNNDLVGQRRAGAPEIGLNNVIYIGRASFRMEPAPLSDEDFYAEAGQDHGPPPPFTADYPVAEIPFALDVEMEEVSDDPAALPAMELEESESVPVLRPVRAGLSGIRLSRRRLVVMGALAFTAGILTSAGARTLAKTPRLAHMRGAAAEAPMLMVDPAAAPAAATPPVAATTVAENAAPTPTRPSAGNAALATGSAASEPTMKAAPGSDRSRDRGARRSHGSRRTQLRSGAAFEEAPEADEAPKASDAPATRDQAGWVDPFAQ